MGRSSSPTTSSATSWKNRFSDKQLERKRLSDRLNQRRTRKQTKEYVAELEKRLDLLTRGEQPTLLSQLIEENRMLRASLTRCQTKMGTVLSCTKEYLEEEDELDDGRLDAGASWQHETSHIRSRHPYSVADTTGRTTSSSLSSFQPSETSRCQVIEPVSIPVSIIFQAARLVLPTALGAAATPFTKSEWLQSIMMWKMVQPPDQDYSFLVSHFNMEKGQICLSTDEIGKSIGIPEFDDHILTCLAEGDDLIDPLIAPQHAWNREPLDTAEKQRRSIMLCAYKLISSWLKFYNSPVEAGLIFWAIYRYFMFLAFPTEGNLQKTPAWLRPTPSQVFCEHPGFVDFLIW
ncbi:hypothetical protein BKA56DRAFT_169300 [Ilyonectria sp. MPI-CAGE-AT-0026]|nr:hypothetical protein BKA56DRAFT_169300 [Ilyonectria sp. MPI-CAGE-AT-0026]